MSLFKHLRERITQNWKYTEPHAKRLELLLYFLLKTKHRHYKQPKMWIRSPYRHSVQIYILSGYRYFLVSVGYGPFILPFVSVQNRRWVSIVNNKLYIASPLCIIIFIILNNKLCIISPDFTVLAGGSCQPQCHHSDNLPGRKICQGQV